MGEGFAFFRWVALTDRQQYHRHQMDEVGMRCIGGVCFAAWQLEQYK